MMVMDAAAGRMEFEDALPQCHPLNPSHEEVMPVMAASYFRNHQHQQTLTIFSLFFLACYEEKGYHLPYLLTSSRIEDLVALNPAGLCGSSAASTG